MQVLIGIKIRFLCWPQFDKQCSKVSYLFSIFWFLCLQDQDVGGGGILYLSCFSFCNSVFLSETFILPDECQCLFLYTNIPSEETFSRVQAFWLCDLKFLLAFWLGVWPACDKIYRLVFYHFIWSFELFKKMALVITT